MQNIMDNILFRVQITELGDLYTTETEPESERSGWVRA